MSARPAAIEPLVDQFSTDPIRHALAEALFAGALPDEVAGLSVEEAARIVDFAAATAATRPAGQPAIRLESLEGQPGRRRMALAIVNDDMPFLVDSVSAAIGAHNLSIDRLLHPIIESSRDASGALSGIGAGGHRESLIYIELERVGARARGELVDQLETVLADVRAAVD
ncbi:MAG: NAD-glutamate dehydrogenase, partial [Sphingomonadaceae bacterium]|nr:NAD-glutamate dehydrogenase [Sphingomonadaceae bacterium]